MELNNQELIRILKWWDDKKIEDKKEDDYEISEKIRSGVRNKKGMFLGVCFHDNDYGRPVKNCLKKLWIYINENNGHLTDSLSNIFVMLHNENVLLTMIERLFILEYLSLEIEFLTRGLHTGKIICGKLPESPNTINYSNNYIDFEVSFHKNDDFTKICDNGESVSLNLETGEIKLF